MNAPPAARVVIGVGNLYRRDDGVGAVVVQLLRLRCGGLDGLELAECDGEPAQLIELWSGRPLAIVVDAVRGSQPGAVHRRSLDAGRHRAGLAGPAAASSHAVDLGEAVALARALDRLPRQLHLYAVEVVDTSFGLGLSEPVAAAATELVEQILAELLSTGAR